MTPANYTTRIIEKLRQGCDLSEIDEIIAECQRETVTAEREACAKIAEEIRQETEIDPDVPEFRRGFAAGWGDGCKEVLDAIRARSEGDSGDKNQ